MRAPTVFGAVMEQRATNASSPTWCGMNFLLLTLPSRSVTAYATPPRGRRIGNLLDLQKKTAIGIPAGPSFAEIPALLVKKIYTPVMYTHTLLGNLDALEFESIQIMGVPQARPKRGA